MSSHLLSTYCIQGTALRTPCAQALRVPCTPPPGRGGCRYPHLQEEDTEVTGRGLCCLLQSLKASGGLPTGHLLGPPLSSVTSDKSLHLRSPTWKTWSRLVPVSGLS